MRTRRFLLLFPAFALVLAGVTACKGGVSFDCPDAPAVASTTVVSTTCSLTYTPAPGATTTTVPPTTTSTTVPPTTTTTTMPTTTTTSSTPPPSEFPTPATTGAPANTAFQPVRNGDMTITQPGTYSGLHVTGALIVKAAGVTITNSWIEGNGVNANEVLDNETTTAGAARMTVTNTTIGNPAVCNGQPGLGEHDYTADHVRIIGMGDGFRVSGNNVTIQNSFVQTCDHTTNHDDGTQIFCPPTAVPQPCQNVVIDHNTLSNAGTRNFTAPVFGGGDPGGSNGQFANSRITNNLLWGGVFTIDTAGKNLTITGNRVATNRWTMPDGSACESNSSGVTTPQGCSYAGWVWGASAVSQSGSTCAQQGVTWTDNRAVPMDSNWQPTNTGTALACA